MTALAAMVLTSAMALRQAALRWRVAMSMLA